MPLAIRALARRCLATRPSPARSASRRVSDSSSSTAAAPTSTSCWCPRGETRTSSGRRCGRSPATADVFFHPWPSAGTHRPTFCVWELGAVAHEREAWSATSVGARRRGAPRDIRDSYGEGGGRGRREALRDLVLRRSREASRLRGATRAGRPNVHDAFMNGGRHDGPSSSGPVEGREVVDVALSGGRGPPPVWGGKIAQNGMLTGRLDVDELARPDDGEGLIRRRGRFDALGLTRLSCVARHSSSRTNASRGLPRAMDDRAEPGSQQALLEDSSRCPAPASQREGNQRPC